MKIKNKLYISLILFFVFVSIVFTIIYGTLLEASHSREELENTDNLARVLFELNMLTTDYMLFSEKRAQVQWESRNNNFLNLLSTIKYNEEEEQLILEEILEINNSINSLFYKLVEIHIELPSFHVSDIHTQLQARIISLILVKYQDIYSYISKLSNYRKATLLKTQDRIVSWNIIIIILFGALIILNLLFINKSILNSLYKFQRSTEIIGSGNLNYTIKIERNDEIGILSNAFNKMVVNLKNTMATRDELEIQVEERTKELKLDIIERKQAEEMLAEEKERLAVTLRSIGDGVITTDIEGKIVLINKVAEELTGWTHSEAKGLPLTTAFNIIHEITRKPLENPVELVLSSGKQIELANNTILVSRDKTERIIADSGSPIKDKDNTTIGVVLVFRDMTEKRKIQNAIQRTSKLESLGILAGGIAHDFNNLLGGIYNYTDLANRISSNHEVSNYLDKTMNTIDRARNLTGQLLTFAKGGAPVCKVQPLFPFIQEATQFALSGTNITCIFDNPKDLWPCNFDKNQIGQVIDNLVINAQQAMPIGGAIELTAQNIILTKNEHSALGEGNYIKLSIKDSGIGIPHELLNRIFDPFFSTKTKGHGLGLATCYSIIARHNGCIDVLSEQGKGSTFIMYLPASIDTISASVEISNYEHKGKGTIVVMDDEEIIRESLSGILESLGYSVVCKENGNETIDFFIEATEKNIKIKGMILDLTIPGGLGGKEVIAEIRKINKEIPVFVSSGYAGDPVIANPAEYGFTASICKPFSYAELIEMLNKHLK